MDTDSEVEILTLLQVLLLKDKEYRKFEIAYIEAAVRDIAVMDIAGNAVLNYNIVQPL